MKAALGALGIVAALATIRTAQAEVCRPPAPGTWSDPTVMALYDSGQDHLAVARKLEAEEQRAAAARAETMFREIDARVACLPPTVIGLAQSLELQGKYLAASAQYRRLLEARSELEKSRFYAASLAEAERALPLALERTARVTLHLRGRDCAVGVPRAFLSGRPASLDRAVRIDPGEHSATIEASGCSPFSRTFTVSSSGEISVVIDLSPLQAASAPAHDRKPVKWLGLPPWVVISGGAVLALGAGVAGYALLSSSPEPGPSYTCSSQATLGCAAF